MGIEMCAVWVRGQRVDREILFMVALRLRMNHRPDYYKLQSNSVCRG